MGRAEAQPFLQEISPPRARVSCGVFALVLCAWPGRPPDIFRWGLPELVLPGPLTGLPEALRTSPSRAFPRATSSPSWRTWARHAPSIRRPLYVPDRIGHRLLAGVGATGTAPHRAAHQPRKAGKRTRGLRGIRDTCTFGRSVCTYVITSSG